MKVGDLIMTNTEARHHGKVGIITKVVTPDDHGLWPDSSIVTVLYSETGEELSWSECRLEVIREGH